MAARIANRTSLTPPPEPLDPATRLDPTVQPKAKLSLAQGYAQPLRCYAVFMLLASGYVSLSAVSMAISPILWTNLQ
jgi:hypothetical protein